MVAAVLVPAVMPGLGNQIIGGSGSGEGLGNGAGASITRINPILDLRRDLTAGQDTNIIWYQTNVKDPQPLRIVTADTFNGQRWAPNTNRISLQNHVQEGLPAAPGLSGDVSAEPRTTRIKVGALKQTYLPLPYPATKVEASGEWLYDTSTLNVIGRGVTTMNQSYTVEHLDVEPTARQLISAPSASANLSSLYLSLPERMPAIIRATAQEVAKTGSQYQQAIRLQRWLRDTGGFTYSTDAPDTSQDDSGGDAIAAFLKEKRGYCVHFASAMAVMARTLNIPARVAIGFLPGDRLSDGRMVISVHDAHAWPELYFEGVGWVRFEPTPRAGLATPPEWAIPPSGTLPEDPLPSASDQATPSVQEGVTPSVAARPTAAGDSNSGSGTGSHLPWRLILVVLLLAGLASSPWLTSRVSSARRWSAASTPAARAEAAWEELRLGLQDLGATWAWTWTPRGVHQRLAAEYDLGEAGASALARLVAGIEAARYAPPGTAFEDEGPVLSVDLTESESAGRSPGGLRDDVQTVLARVATAIPRGRRWRARWAPPSAGAALTSLLSPRRGSGPDAESMAASGTDTIGSESREHSGV
jgi:transglutaminase-like putative cysteine protease